MSQPKHTAMLRGDVLQDMATGQLFKLHPSEEEMQRGVWEYNSEADGHRWNFVVIEGTTYAINGCFIDWEDEEVKEWNATLMGQWPFGNKLTEAEELMREVEDVLLGLDYYLEGELEWMNRMDEEMEDDSDEDSDEDFTTEDEGYNTSPEVDFDLQDYWALGLNNFLWRIDLYKEGEDGFWTLKLFLYGISSITAFILCDTCYLGCNSDDNVSDNIL